MQLINKFNEGILFLLCVTDIFSKYTWVIPLKDKKYIKITNAFQNILRKFNCKPNKIWVDKGSQFYNRSMKPFLQNNDIEIYSMHVEGKSVIAKTFIRTLIKKMYTYMTSIFKNVSVTHWTHTAMHIIAKWSNVKSNKHIDSSEESSDKYPKFKNCWYC